MPQHDKTLSRRSFLTVLGLSATGIGAGAVLAACSDDSKGTNTNGAQGSATNGDSSNNNASGETRKFTDDVGREVEIPAQPQRLVSTKAITSLVALGVTPVGIANMEIDLYPYPDVVKKLKNDGVTDLVERELNIEKVISLQPDVIVASTPRDDDNRDTLAAIAPP